MVVQSGRRLYCHGSPSILHLPARTWDISHKTNYSVMASDVSHERRSPTHEMGDKEFIATIELSDRTVEEMKLISNRGTTFGFKTSSRQQTEEFVITAAHLHRSGFNNECLRVIKQLPEKNAQSEITDIDRWL